MIYAVDKIEGNLATLVGDNGDMIVLDTSALDFTVSENDVLIYDKDANTYRPDPETTKKRLDENKKRLRKLFDR